MDITPKQLVALANALKWKLGRIVSHLQNLDTQISGIRDSNEAQNEEWKTNPPTLTAILNEPQAERDKRDARETRHEQHEEDEAGRDRVRLVVEIAGVTFAAILAALTLQSVKIARSAATTAAKSASASEAQAKAAQAQTDVARQSAQQAMNTFREDQRAWVVPTKPFLSSEVGQPKIAGSIIQNIGKTPAIDVYNAGQLTFEDAPIKDITSYLKSHPKILGTPLHLGVLFPTQTYVMGGVQQGTISADYARYLASGKTFPYAIGEITYKDVFGRPHKTKFCFLWSPEVRGFDACPFFNSGD